MSGFVHGRSAAAVVVAMVVSATVSCTPAPDAAPAPTAQSRITEDPTTSEPTTEPTTTEPTTREPTTEPTSPTTPPSPPSPTETEDEPLLQTLLHGLFDVIPAGRCTVNVIAGSSSTVVTVERLDTSRVCFEGLRSAPSTPPVQLTTPSGREVEVAIVPGIGWVIVPTVVPGAVDEIGTYTFRIVEPSPSATTPPSPPGSATAGTPTQGAVPSPGSSAVAPAPRITSGRLEVVPAQKRRLRLVVSGRALDIQLAGFPSSQDIRLAVYARGTDEDYHPVVELPSAHTDARGEAAVRSPLPSSVTTGAYGLWTDPAPSTSHCIDSPCIRFQVTSP